MAPPSLRAISRALYALLVVIGALVVWIFEPQSVGTALMLWGVLTIGWLCEHGALPKDREP